jgi:hypothetical protein
MDYELNLPFVPTPCDVRGPCAYLDHESASLTLRAELSVEQLDALIVALCNASAKLLGQWCDGLLVL